jgi:hypothetical protein
MIGESAGYSQRSMFSRGAKEAHRGVCRRAAELGLVSKMLIGSEARLDRWRSNIARDRWSGVLK